MENEDEKYLPHFEIITMAGAARSCAMEAIAEARSGAFDEAEKLLKEAKDSMVEAHEKMFDMMQQEAAGNPVEMHIIAVHAQDHITMATIMTDMGTELLHLYRKLYEK